MIDAPLREHELIPASVVQRAHESVHRHLAVTPLLAAPQLGERCYLKVETFQPTGSFKVRGAFAALATLPAGTSVVTVSTGNHALAVAFAAAKLAIDAMVVVPSTVAPSKLARLTEMGANVVVEGATYDEARQFALAQRDGNRQFVSPFNAPEVIAGQSSLAREILDQLGGPARVVCPIGGGGLAAGVGLLMKPAGGQVIGVEIEGWRTMHLTRQSGHIQRLQGPGTIADGITGNLEADSITVPLTRELVDKVLAVTDPDVSAAIQWLAESHGLIVEGAGAVSTAAQLSGVIPEQSDLPTVFVLTGRNGVLPSARAA